MERTRMEESDVCSICAEGGGAMHTLACGHAFHPGCIIPWFRFHSETCPNCRTDEDVEVLAQRSASDRIASLRRRKHLPAPVRATLRRMDEARETRVRLRKELHSFLGEHAEVFRTERRMRTRIRHYARRYHTMHTQLSICSVGLTPLLSRVRPGGTLVPPDDDDGQSYFTDV